MYKERRNFIDKLGTLLFGKDLRVTQGEAYKEVREYDFSSYYPEDKYIKNQPLPSENVFDIRSYGADVNNENNAAQISAAIADAAKAGGTVLVDGGDYITTTVELKSGVTLFISRNSSLSANDSGKGYEGKKAILYAEDAKKITLTGGGKIKGNGHLFGFRPVAAANRTSPAPYIDVIEMRRDYRSQLRFAHPSKYGGPIYFKDCENISADNFIIENSAYWTFKISNCENVSIKNFVINNNRNVANADGIDIAGTSNVNIEHCFISTADDGIVIKNACWLGNCAPMSGVHISDCEIISRTNAVKVGTETTYDISDVSVKNCRLLMTDLYPGSVSGISLEACDGTVLDGVEIDNIYMNRCTCPIFIRLANRNRASEVNEQSANAIEFGAKGQKGGESDKNMFDMKSEVKNITASSITADGAEIPIIIAGCRQKGITKRVENVALNNITLNFADIPETVDRRLFIPEYACVYPEGWRFRNLPAYALWTRHTKNITVNNLVCNHPQPTWKKHTVRIDDVE